jgi:hypothetical protein
MQSDWEEKSFFARNFWNRQPFLFHGKKNSFYYTNFSVI